MTQDYNPDREKHRKRKYMVVKADPQLESVPSSKGDLKFGKNGAFLVDDPKFASEIRDTIGKRATVSRVNAEGPADRGHTYFFGGWPEMPWKRSKDNGDQETQEDGQGNEGEREAQAEESQEDKAVEPAAIHPVDVESWAYAGGMATQDGEEETKYE